MSTDRLVVLICGLMVAVAAAAALLWHDPAWVPGLVWNLTTTAIAIFVVNRVLDGQLKRQAKERGREFAARALVPVLEKVLQKLQFVYFGLAKDRDQACVEIEPNVRAMAHLPDDIEKAVGFYGSLMGAEWVASADELRTAIKDMLRVSRVDEDLGLNLAAGHAVYVGTLVRNLLAQLDDRVAADARVTSLAESIAQTRSHYAMDSTPPSPDAA